MGVGAASGGSCGGSPVVQVAAMESEVLEQEPDVTELEV